MFFFFKQKTAYEMRISDWSSDVCSSDLQGKQNQGADLIPGAKANLIPDFSPKLTAAHRPDDRRIANGALGPHQSKGQHIARRQGANAVQKSGQPPASQAADLCVTPFVDTVP